jgi:hypothetical protein
MSEQIEIAVSIIHTTDAAILVTDDGYREEWIPLSQITDAKHLDLEVGETVVIRIPEWLAIKKGFL